METKISKFTGTAEMDQALDRMVQASNAGFTGGRVTKHDLLSWIAIYFERECFKETLDKIRQDHFDQVAHVESVLKLAKQARKTGAPAPDLAALLSPVLSGSSEPKTRKRRKAAIEAKELLDKA